MNLPLRPDDPTISASRGDADSGCRAEKRRRRRWRWYRAWAGEETRAVGDASGRRREYPAGFRGIELQSEWKPNPADKEPSTRPESARLGSLRERARRTRVSRRGNTPATCSRAFERTRARNREMERENARSRLCKTEKEKKKRNRKRWSTHFVLNLTHFVCFKRSVQVLVLI